MLRCALVENMRQPSGDTHVFWPRPVGELSRLTPDISESPKYEATWPVYPLCISGTSLVRTFSFDLAVSYTDCAIEEMPRIVLQ